MAGQVERTLALKIIGDIRGLNKTKRGLGSFTRSTASWAKAFTGGAILGGIAAIGDAFVQAGKDLYTQNKLLKQTQAVLKSTGHAAGISSKAIVDLSSDLEDLTGVDQEAIQAGENLLLTFSHIKGPVFRDATSVITDMSVALGTSLPAAALKVGRALDNPVKGMTALTRVGVTFSEKQQAVIKHLVATGHTAQAQQMILDELRKKFGGAAKAAGDAAFGIAHIQQSFGNLFQSIIKGDPKAIGVAIDQIGTSINRALFGFSRKGKKGNVYHVKGVIDIAGNWWKTMADGIKKVDWAKVIGDTLNAALTAVQAGLQSGAIFDLALLAGVIAAGVFAIDTFINVATGLFSLGKWVALTAVKGVVWLLGASLGFTLRLGMFVLKEFIDAASGLFGVARWVAVTAVKGVVWLLGAAFGLALRLGMFVAKEFIDAVSGLFSVGKWTTVTAIRGPMWILGSVLGSALQLGIIFGLAGIADVIISTIRDQLKNTLPPDIFDIFRGAVAGGPFAFFFNAPGDRAPGNARGTSYWRGGPSWVGEAGPELVNLPRGSQVIPHSRSMAMAGGNTYNIHVTVATGVNPVEVGRQTVYAIQQYEKRAGSAWRR